MSQHEIDKFTEARCEYLRRLQKIRQAQCDLDDYFWTVRDALRATIDNGLDSHHVACVADEYVKHGFDSREVQEFLADVHRIVFGDSTVAYQLEVTAIDISTATDDIDEKHAICNNKHIAIDDQDHVKYAVKCVVTFCDVSKTRLLRLQIPIKEVTTLDVVNWETDRTGQYILYAYPVDAKDIRYWKYDLKTICKSFSTNDIVAAIEKYLDGSLDSLMQSDVVKEIQQYIVYNNSIEYEALTLSYNRHHYRGGLYDYSPYGYRYDPFDDYRAYHMEKSLNDISDDVADICHSNSK